MIEDKQCSTLSNKIGFLIIKVNRSSKFDDMKVLILFLFCVFKCLVLMFLGNFELRGLSF